MVFPHPQCPQCGKRFFTTQEALAHLDAGLCRGGEKGRKPATSPSEHADPSPKHENPHDDRPASVEEAG